MADPVSSLGLDPDFSATVEVVAEAARETILRPFLQLEISASIVDGDPHDKDRWYRYSAGITSGSDEPGAAVLTTIKDGKKTKVQGPASLISASASDSLGGSACQLRFPRTGLMTLLAPLLRPMDRVRLTLTLPGRPGWLLFDGLLRRITGSRRAGGGWSSQVQLASAGLECLLQGAVFNWQGFVHPASDILRGPAGETLFQQIGGNAHAPHLVVRAFVESALASAMGIRIGDLQVEQGLPILDYVNPAANDATQFESWPGVAYPLPRTLIQSQATASFWALIQNLADPYLHEVFVGYREEAVEAADRMGSLVPTIVFRPRPFPGTKDYDRYWLALPVVKVGGTEGTNVMGLDDALSGESHPNVFHWAGVGLGDHSTEVFQAKIAWGFVRSNSLVNRYGYSSVPVSSKVSPIGPDSAAIDYAKFGKTFLLHYAKQEAPVSLLKQRNVDAPFIPVRPGQVMEDHTFGNDTADLITGYVTSTSFSLSIDGDSVSMSMSASVERCLRGTDAAGYPEAVRALVPDLEFVPYAGADGLGDLGPPPAVGSVYTPGPAAKASRPEVPNYITTPIKAASKRQSIPAWLIAHVLHNETAFGKNPNNSRDGIAQITDIALADLTSIAYKNPDGTPFCANDRRDMGKCIHACAAYLKRCQGLLEAMPGGFPANGQSYYSWVLRAYRWGPGAARSFGATTGWTWPDAGEAYPDYRRYWSPAGVESGRALWGYLG